MDFGAGEFRHRITIEQTSRVKDAAGASADTWTEVATVWAKVQALRGREYFAGEQMQEAVDYRVVIRARAGVDRTMRVVWGAVTMDIVGVVEVGERREYIELMCMSGVRNAR